MSDNPSRLDPEEVRRRSARVRLWQNLGALVALSLAVGFFVLPLFTLDPGEIINPKRQPKEPTGEPRTSWDTVVDEDFPLTVGLAAPANGSLPDPTRDGPGAGLDAPMCGTGGFSDGVVDRLAVRAPQPGGREGRELVTLDDDAAAERLLADVREAAEACEGWSVADREVGDQALDLARPEDGRLRQLVRVGNAVLALEHRSAPLTDETSTDVALDQLAVVAERIADEMCGYALRPC